jgi:hypothetical protein
MIQEKERVFTFYSNLKSESGNVEIKFDFKESEFKKLSEQNEQEGNIQTSTYGMLCGIDKLRKLLEELTNKPTHISEFSIYEEPQKQ